MKVLLCCIVKMENNYLDEWIEHHIGLGFDKIVLYDNNDREGKYEEDSGELTSVKDGMKVGFVEKIDIDGFGMQTRCYNECYKNNSQSYDWLFFLDADEYFVTEGFNDVKEFLSQKIFRDYNMIHMPWKIYGDSDLVKSEGDYSTKSRFTKESCKYFDQHKRIEIKSAIRGSLGDVCFSINAHTICSKELRCCDNIGRNKTPDDPFTNEPAYQSAWVNHYITRSLDEFFNIKLIRCGPSEHKALRRYNLGYYFRHNDMNSKKLIYLKNKLNKEDFKDLKNKFMSDFKFL